MFASADSLIRIYNWSISNNFAVISGVIKSSSNGVFEIYSSKIIMNIALSIPIAQAFDNPSSSLIDNWIINSNGIYSKDSIISYLSPTQNWSKLFHLFINAMQLALIKFWDNR